MSNQSDVTIPHERPDHFIVTIPHERPDHLNDRERMQLQIDLQASRVLERDPISVQFDLQASHLQALEYLLRYPNPVFVDLPYSPATADGTFNFPPLRPVSQANRRYPNPVFVDLPYSPATADGTFNFLPLRPVSQANRRYLNPVFVDLPYSPATADGTFNFPPLRPVSQAYQRYPNPVFVDLPYSPATADGTFNFPPLRPVSQANRRYPNPMFLELLYSQTADSTFNFPTFRPASHANQREPFLGIMMNPVDFMQALEREDQAPRELILMNSSTNRVSFHQASQRVRQDHRLQEEWYTFIGLIFAISCGIYGIMLVLTEQMYKEEDGSFFSHHHVMVTISVLAMVCAAFLGVFLATADPADRHRKHMRFLLEAFVYAACFGPAVMFMAMLSGHLV